LTAFPVGFCLQSGEEEEMLKDFKEFVLRGNVVDLAVAVVLGAAFGTLVAALVEDLLTPVIAAIVGKPDFSNLTFTINGSVFKYGAFLNAVIAFLLIAAAVFFFVVKPVNDLMARRKTELPVDPTTRQCPECLSEIPMAARRCAFCTAEVGAAA
jgi:large conductance mechanosensitive channel